MLGKLVATKLQDQNLNFIFLTYLSSYSIVNFGLSKGSTNYALGNGICTQQHLLRTFNFTNQVG